MEWGGGTIGWQTSSTEFEVHKLSGETDNNIIGCLYSTTYSTKYVSGIYYKKTFLGKNLFFSIQQAVLLISFNVAMETVYHNLLFVMALRTVVMAVMKDVVCHSIHMSIIYCHDY